MAPSMAPAAVRLFEVDPELLAAVPAGDRPLAERIGLAPAERIPAGRWNPEELGAPPWGALVAEGLIAHEVDVATSGAAELLGPGDLLLPGAAGEGGGEAISADARWTVLEPARLAILDDHVLPLMQRWPLLGAALLRRSERRADRLAVARAISHLTRVDLRVLAIFWQLAERWGRVTPDGVVLPLRLTHRTVGRLIGARRPSVTTAISDLGRRELLARRADGSWLVLGPPPRELAQVGVAESLLAAPAPPRRTRAAIPAVFGPQPAPSPSTLRVAEQVRELVAADELDGARP